MTQKKDDLMETLGDQDEYVLWLAQYLVMKRASIEPNFHTLYANFLEKLANDRLYDAVLKETYANIRILLSSDKSIANFSDRSLLKNLGHWLGLMTLARNQPILLVDLDMKPMIIEAYHNGQQVKVLSAVQQKKLRLEAKKPYNFDRTQKKPRKFKSIKNVWLSGL